MNMSSDRKLNKNAVSSENNYDEALVSMIMKSQEEWQSTLDAISDYIFLLNMDGVIKRANVAFSRRFGRHPREVVGQLVYEVFRSEFSSLGDTVKKLAACKAPEMAEIEE